MSHPHECLWDHWPCLLGHTFHPRDVRIANWKLLRVPSSPRSSMPHLPGCLPSGDQQRGLRVKSLLSQSLLSFRVPQEVAAVDALCSLVGSACPQRGGAESGVRPDAAERRVPSSRVRHGPVHGDVLGEARVASPHCVSDLNQTANTGWRSHGPHVNQFTHPCFRT